MPFLPFFADVSDARLIIDWLNNRNDIAFLLPDGPDTVHRLSSHRWKAVRRLDHLGNGDPHNDFGDYYNYLLWLTSEPIEYTDDYPRQIIIRDPWEGWEGRMVDPRVPQMGPGYSMPDVDSPGIFSLELLSRHRPYTEWEMEHLEGKSAGLEGPDDFMRCSTLYWYGSSSKAALEFWQLLAAWVSEHATPLGEVIEDENMKWQYWAFPSALRKLKEGMAHDADGFSLDAAIKSAPLPDH